MRRAWMPLYWADLIGDTQDLSTLQFGAYLKLIGHYWAHGGLPGDVCQLCNISGLSPQEWRWHHKAIKDKFYMAFDDAWFHKRIEAELQHADNKSKAMKAISALGVAARQSNGQPHGQPTVNLARASTTVTKKEPSIPYKDSQNEPLSVPAKRTRKKLAYPEQFESFWRGYPTDANMSKSEALQQWAKLDDQDRAAAEKSLPSFKAYCRSHKDYRPVHANRYLSTRRFDGHLATAEKIETKAGVFVKQDTEAWAAWTDFYKRTKGKSPPTNGSGGWYFPSEFPEERHNA